MRVLKSFLVLFVISFIFVGCSNSSGGGGKKSLSSIPMVFIQGGTFTMGSPADEAGRNWIGFETETQRSVTVSGFYMSKYAITQAEWKDVMGNNPSWFNRRRLTGYVDSSNHPVERVSWYAVIRYCNKRSVMEGLTPVYSIGGSADEGAWGATPTSNNETWNAVVVNWSANGYRLPTEAEWEYAARAGTTTAFNTGGNITTEQANFNGQWPYDPTPGGSGWFPEADPAGLFRKQTTAVGSFSANAWGLYDMHGNVWEWVWDRHENTPTGADNPTGAVFGTDRVIRGGSWDFLGQYLRSAIRGIGTPSDRNNFTSFRVVRSQ